MWHMYEPTPIEIWKMMKQLALEETLAREAFPPFGIILQEAYLCVDLSYFMHIEKANHVLVTSEELC